jgi:site-specific DNA-methyltransferase (adenine-specific)
MVTLHQGECEEVLKGIPSESVDMVFADPPFNVGKKYAGKNGDSRSDYYEWCEAWVSECFRVLKDTGTFYHMTIDRHLERLFPIMGKYGKFVNLIKWRNVSAEHDPRQFWNSTQPILMYAKSDEYKFNTYAQARSQKQMVVSWSKERAARTKGQMMDFWDDIRPVFAGSIVHPEAILKPGTKQKAHLAQMPIGIAGRCILFSTDEGDTVLDPFNGSGTTGAACLNLNRDFIGIEREQEYIEMARERWARISMQASLFMPANKVLQPTTDHAEVENHSHQPGLL